MLKFDDVVTMANYGLFKATSHTLTSQGAYTLTKLKSEVERLAKEWMESYNKLPQEVGIEDTKVFDARQEELSKKKRTKAEDKELEENNRKALRLRELRGNLNGDEVAINIKPMSWEDWHNLKQENKDILVSIRDVQGNEVDKKELFEFVELVGENVIWKAPEE